MADNIYIIYPRFPWIDSDDGGGGIPIPPELFDIGGTVSGDIISGVLINLGGDIIDYRITDTLGDYLFADLSGGSYTVTASADGYDFTPVSYNISLSADDLDNDFASLSAVSICAGGDPEVELAITTSNTGTYTWCGQTWNMPADSGVTKKVCPTKYQALKGAGYALPFIMEWRYIPGDGGGFPWQESTPELRLYDREAWMSQYGYGGLGGTSTYNHPNEATATVSVFNSNLALKQSKQNVNGCQYPPFPYTCTSWQTYSEGPDDFNLFPAPPPGRTLVDRARNLFGSYTDGSVTYTWSKGTGW